MCAHARLGECVRFIYKQELALYNTQLTNKLNSGFSLLNVYLHEALILYINSTLYSTKKFVFMLIDQFVCFPLDHYISETNLEMTFFHFK